MENRKSRFARIFGKLAVSALLAVTVCFLTYCAAESEVFSTFEEGTTVNGIDVSGLTAAEAEREISLAVGDYALEITLTSEGVSETETEDETQTEETADDSEEEEDGSTTSVVYTISGSDISLSLPEDFSLDELLSTQKEAAKELEEGESLSDEYLVLTYEDLITFDEEALALLAADFVSQFEMSDEASDAVLSYDEEAGEYVVVSETYGGELSAEVLTNLALEAAENLEGTIDISDLIDVPAITSDNETLLNTLLEANTYISVELTYTFEVNDGSETITKEDIVSWLVYDEESVTINIANEELQSFVDDLAEEYSVYNSTSQFLTTSGSYITVKVSSTGETVDSDALYNDIYDNIVSGTSGTFEAPYDETTIEDNDGIVDFDGTYVEVNLTSQHLYFYKNGSLVLESDFVSGCVAEGHATPTGVFTIKSKETNRYLTGDDYRSWVYYWMPFNGGIGFHDATWRSYFGGSIYLQNGSHGCINLPYSAARTLYNNISVGTYVVVYGGETEITTEDQTVSVASSFTKTEGDSSFNLNASTDGDGTLTYSSSDTSVVTVDSDGKVTVVGAGEATITVTASETDSYYEASAETTVTVSHDYEYDSASWGSDYSTCTIKLVCTGCGASKNLTADVTSEVTKAATSSSTGTKVYTATASYGGIKYTVTLTTTIPKTASETTTTAAQTTEAEEE